MALVITRWLPGYSKSYEEQISARLGVIASIERVTHPRPGITQLEGLRLSHPETSDPLFRASVVEVAHRKRTLSAVVTQPRLDAPQLSPFFRTLHDRLLTAPPSNLDAVTIDCRKLNLWSTEGSHHLTSVSVRWEPTDEGPQASIQFRVNGLDMSEPAYVRIRRDRVVRPAETRWHFHSANIPLPCSLFAPLLPVLGKLGPYSRFNGAVWGAHGHGGWWTEVNGHLSDVDWGQLVTDPSPHTLTGTGNVAIVHARIEDGRLVTGAGSITAGGGEVSHSILDAAVQTLDFRYGRIQTPNPRELLVYDQLAVGFAIDSDGLVIQGLCQQCQPRTVIKNGDSSLLLDPIHQPLPMDGLAQMLPSPWLRRPASVSFFPRR